MLKNFKLNQLVEKRQALSPQCLKLKKIIHSSPHALLFIPPAHKVSIIKRRSWGKMLCQPVLTQIHLLMKTGYSNEAVLQQYWN